MKKSLVLSIIIFLIVGCCALYLVLNKGHIGDYALVSTVPSEEEKIPVVTIALDKEYISSVDEEDVAKITVTVDGVETTEGIEFEISDEKVAKVNDKNEIVAVSDGKAKVTAKYKGVEAEANFKVITPIESMTFTSTNSNIRVGRDLQLKLKVSPSDAHMDTLTYVSSDESVATVTSDGIVTGVAPGKVTITLTDSYSGIEKKVNLTIRK